MKKRYILLVSLAMALPCFAKEAPLTESIATQAPSLYEAALPDMPAVVTGQAQVGDQSTSVFVDTGSVRPFLIDKGLAQRKFGSPVEEEYVNGSKAPLYRLPEIFLGRLSLPAADVPAIDLEPFRVAHGSQVEGVIGWKGLAGKTLVLDHDRRVFSILEASAPAPVMQSSLPIEVTNNHPLIRTDGHPLIHARLGGAEIPLMIDTGSDSILQFTDAQFQRLVDEGLIQEEKSSAVSVNNDGLSTSRSGRFVKGELLGVNLTAMPTNSRPGDNLNIIGSLFLLKLNVVIATDPPSFSYTVRKAPPPPVNITKMMSVLFIYSKGLAIVAKIKPGGPAEKAGLKVKDEVVSIDQLQSETLSILTLSKLCQDRAGKPVTLRVRRGETIQAVELPLSPVISAWDATAHAN